MIKILSDPYPLKLAIYKKGMGSVMAACKVLPSTSSSSSTPSSPGHTHTPLCQSLLPWGQWGRHSRAWATAVLCFRGKEGERDAVSQFWIQNILPSCLAYSILTLHNAANLFSLSSRDEFELRVSELQDLTLFLTC